MTPVFADTFYYVALLNRADFYHEEVADFARLSRRVVTTQWVLAELANAFAESAIRRKIGSFVAALERDTLTEVIPASDEFFHRGLARYGSRSDKGWSLTDCLSFIVMEDRNLVEVLTADHHFAQARFKPLFGPR